MISEDPARDGYDVILVSGDAFADHPSFGPAVIARVLESNGLSVGIISQPDWRKKEEFERLGRPRLFFGVTAGNLDSMVSNYTPLKHKREYDAYSIDGEPGKRPDRATIVYTSKLREAFKEMPIIIGGIEASLRRLAHYDYWDNDVRRSVLFDSKADVLVYGMGEKAVSDLAHYYKEGTREERPTGIENTCIISRDVPEGHVEIPSFERVRENTEDFIAAHDLTMKNENIAQRHGDRFLVQYPMHVADTAELDRIYSLPYTRRARKGDRIPALRAVRFSIISHRGCFGGCSFCALSLHQGKVVRSRSESSILREVELITSMKGFRGTITDLGGPTANMYGMDCPDPCERKDRCLTCDRIVRDHERLLSLMKKVRGQEVKHLFISSGIRYDLALDHRRYLREVIEHCTPGRLKVAPEHVNREVLELMGKPMIEVYMRFLRIVRDIDPSVVVLPYFMAGHPGCGIPQMQELMDFVTRHGEFEQCQLFTPTPMTRSTCMYWTGMDPVTREKIYVPYTYREKKVQKAMMLPRRMDARKRLREYMKDIDVNM
ncbi:MAG: YgiQ family radical SAM protein [Candidatus Thermoplasmatota archaeon]|nr:YgiQ family radical SAM protein [Candidatus Thermoplasmatota archaeon]